MPNLPISGLPTGTPQDTDLHIIVDTTDHTQAPTGTDKQVTFEQIKANLTEGGSSNDVIYINSGGYLVGSATLTFNPSNNAVTLGGNNNVVSGTNSIAGGNNANSNTNNTFVWADGQSGSFTSTVANSFIVRAEGGVGIGTASPTAGSQLEIASTVGGLLLPRMTTTQRNAITVTSSQNSLLIYNTTTLQFEYYDFATMQWLSLVSGTGNTTINTSVASISYSGPYASSLAGSLSITTIADADIPSIEVILGFVAALGTATTGAIISVSPALPSSVWPGFNIDMPLMIRNSGANAYGSIHIDTSGNITVGVGADLGDFTNSGQCGIPQQAVVYKAI